MKYLGATNSFVRAPFILGGIIVGVVSAAAATGLTHLIYSRIAAIVGEDVSRILSVNIVPAEQLTMVLLVMFLMMESSTVMLISVWFAAGSLAALIASLFGAQLWLQGLLFVLVSGGLLALLRPVFQKYLKPRIVKTNVDSVIGSCGLVIAEVDNLKAEGRVKLGGMEWSARSTNGQNLPVGMQVKVDRIEGVKAFVSPAEMPVNT